MVAKNKPNEFTIVRVYDAPVKAVWDAWTDPEQVVQWWGPRGFTLTTHSKDLRAGGTWVYTMHGPDGTDYPNRTYYYEVEKYSRLVYDHGASGDRPPLFRVTAVFTEVKKGKTRLEMTMALATAEAAAEIKKFIKKAGGEATWDRLGEFLAKRLADKEQFIINRTFDAPLSLVSEMWTNPKHFSKWLPPTGMDMKLLRADIKPGGNIFYLMTNHQGLTMYGRAEYQEVSPTRLVYTQQFCDEKEKLSRHPLAPTWPATMLTVVNLEEEAPHRTRVTVTWECHGPTTREELETFIKERGGMTQGWTGSFDKLEAYLSEQEGK